MNLQETGDNDRKDNNPTNGFTIVLFVIYLIALFWILLFKLGVHFSNMGTRRANLIPFSQPFLHHKMDVGEIVMNVLIFVPLGIYTGVLCNKWSFGKKLLFFFLTSFIIESLQFILAVGVFDTTDMITNTTGGIIGYILFMIIERAFNNSSRAQTFINILAAIATAIMIVLLSLLKLSMLPIRYQ